MAKQAGRGWVWALLLAGGCFSTSDDPGGSSATGELVSCGSDTDCAGKGAGATCGSERVCIDAAGEPIRLLPAGGSGSGASGGEGGGSGATGGSGGNGGGSGGSDGGSSGGGSGATGGTGGSGGNAGSGTGTVLPDCASFGSATNATCMARDDQPIPECCDGTMHMQCQYDACTNAIPGSCSGTWQPVAGSTSCGGGGGYQPCGGKACGDSCMVCDPSDPGCVETTVPKLCAGPGGDCVEGAVDCQEPVACDTASVDGTKTCADGEVCCAVGRCGPLVIGNEGICEPADPVSGGCMACACEMDAFGCPICASPDTPIATPDGERAIAELRVGDLVWSMHAGEVVAVPIVRTGRMVAVDHAVVRVVLDDGSTIEVSGSHPTADGRRLDALEPGDALGDVHVRGVEMIPYLYGHTYDILPASDSGTYFAGGALLGSTLR